MIEKQFEDILIKYPELIEDGLKLRGRQVNVKGKRVDLQFEDRHGLDLVVELKKGPIKREHIAQLMDYEGYFLSSDDPTVRVMLVGNRVPPNLRRSLDHHGFEWKEIKVGKLISHLKEKGDEELLKIFAEEDSNRRPTKHKPRSRKIRVTKPAGQIPPLHTARSFEELREVLTIRRQYYPTNHMDMLLLENSNKPLSRLVREFRGFAEKVGNDDFKSTSILKKHIKYREEHDRWLFRYSGDPDDPVVKLIGLDTNLAQSPKKDDKPLSAHPSIKDMFYEVFSRHVGESFTRNEIIRMLRGAYPHVNESSLIPSDYCYNVINRGISFKNHLFEKIAHGYYKVLGPHYKYTGTIYWKDKPVGEWESGNVISDPLNNI